MVSSLGPLRRVARELFSKMMASQLGGAWRSFRKWGCLVHQIPDSQGPALFSEMEVAVCKVGRARTKREGLAPAWPRPIAILAQGWVNAKDLPAKTRNSPTALAC